MRATVKMLVDLPNIDHKIERFARQKDNPAAQKKAQLLRDSITLKKGETYTMMPYRAAELVELKAAQIVKNAPHDRYPKEKK